VPKIEAPRDARLIAIPRPIPRVAPLVCGQPLMSFLKSEGTYVMRATFPWRSWIGLMADMLNKF
jgi:hypothetical protein